MASGITAMQTCNHFMKFLAGSKGIFASTEKIMLKGRNAQEVF
jgi:hypothetical protein